MSAVNKYTNHLVVYAEDDATKELANSFLDNLGFYRRQVKMCRGWSDAVEQANSDDQLKSNGARRVVILIDMDKDKTRIEEIKQKIGPDFQEYIFVVGWRGTIEELKANLGCAGSGFVKMGQKLAEDCMGGCKGAWQDDAFAELRPDFERLHKLLNLIKQEHPYRPEVVSVAMIPSVKPENDAESLTSDI